MSLPLPILHASVEREISVGSKRNCGHQTAGSQGSGEHSYYNSSCGRQTAGSQGSGEHSYYDS